MQDDLYATKIRIVLALQKANKPLILQHIANITELSPQLVAYNINQMLRWGIVTSVEHDEKTYYALQPAYYDAAWLESLYAALTPFVTAMGNQLIFEETKIVLSKSIIRNLTMFLRLFEAKIETLNLKKT